MSFQHNVLLATQQINQELKEAGFSKMNPLFVKLKVIVYMTRS